MVTERRGPTGDFQAELERGAQNAERAREARTPATLLILGSLERRERERGPRRLTPPSAIPVPLACTALRQVFEKGHTVI